MQKTTVDLSPFPGGEGVPIGANSNKVKKDLSKFLKQTKQLDSLFGTEYDVNDARLFYGHEEPEYLMSNGRNVAGLDVSDRKFLCTNCTKSYKHKHHLLRHLRLECGVEPKMNLDNQAVDKNMSQFLKANKHSDVFFETEYMVGDSRLVSNHEEQDYCMQGRRNIPPVNVSERKFVCPNCNKSYKYKHDLLRHLRLECGVEPKNLISAACNLLKSLRPYPGFRAVDGGVGSEQYLQSVADGGVGSEQYLQSVADGGVGSEQYLQSVADGGFGWFYGHTDARDIPKDDTEESKSPQTFTFTEETSSYGNLSKFLRGTKHSFGLFGTEFAVDNSQSLFTQTEQELLMRRRRNVVELNDLAQKFVCPNCTKSYKHKHHLLRHLRLECGVEPKYEMPELTQIWKANHFCTGTLDDKRQSRSDRLVALKGLTMYTQNEGVFERITLDPVLYIEPQALGRACTRLFAEKPSIVYSRKGYINMFFERDSSMASEETLIEDYGTMDTSRGIEALPPKFVCRNCGAAYKNKHHLVRHLRNGPEHGARHNGSVVERGEARWISGRGGRGTMAQW
uniref:C2H2-type domain-containing protein n=1 Tax=Timema poppense TaxID=170557 RepID=A0A7R9GYZ2_TIMPO|nr:unnamed protein product [Timema poppensis]